MFFCFNKDNIKIVDLINTTITLTLIEEEKGIKQVSYTCDSQKSAMENLIIMKGAYDLVPTERPFTYTSNAWLSHCAKETN